MGSRRLGNALGVFFLVVLVVLAGSVGVATVAPDARGPFDGESIDGQSPAQYQPDQLEGDVDPETGEVRVDTQTEDRRILVDTQHDNQFAERDIEPLAEAAFAAGHRITIQDDDADDYDELLSEYDALLVVQPTDGFTPSQVRAVRNFTDAGGRVVVLAEPPTVSIGGGLIVTTIDTVSFGATNLTAQYGTLVGSEALYNLDDSRTDNNFKSIYASPTGDDSLTEGVETVSFDSSGYLVRQEGSDATTIATAAEGTRTTDTRRNGTYATAVRNGNLTVVADSSFIKRSELYDVDNEVFVGNLLEFLATGERAPLAATGDETGDSAGGATDGPTANETASGSE